MNLKNILQENMRRFNTKNLNEIDAHKLEKKILIVEQTSEPEAQPKKIKKPKIKNPGTLKGNNVIKIGSFIIRPPGSNLIGTIFRNPKKSQMFPVPDSRWKRWLGVEQKFSIAAGWYGQGDWEAVRTQTIKTGSITTDIDPINITFKFNLEDPFEFDRTDLYPDAANTLDTWIEDVNTSIKNAEPAESAKYIKILKDTPINVLGYASIDALSNFEVKGGYLGCRKESGQLRKDYNKCLSIARANKIIKYLQDSDSEGILSKLTYTAVGMGETNKFSGKIWKHDILNPTVNVNSPHSKNDTKADRRFIIELPEYKSNNPDPDPVVTNDVDINGNNTSPTYIRWYNPAALKLIYNDPEFVQDRRQHININTVYFQEKMGANNIKYDSTIKNPQDGQMGDLVFDTPGAVTNMFNIGWVLGLDKILVGAKRIPASADLLVSKAELETALGAGYLSKYFFPYPYNNSGGVGEVLPAELTKDTFKLELPNNFISIFKLGSDNSMESDKKITFESTKGGKNYRLIGTTNFIIRNATDNEKGLESMQSTVGYNSATGGSKKKLTFN